MSSAIMFRCHACKARIKAPTKLIGQVRPCPRCKQAVRVRIEPPEDAAPVMVQERVEEETAVIPALTDGEILRAAKKRGTKVILTPG